MRQWLKKELKKDFLKTWVEKSIKFTQSNKEKVIAGTAITLVLVIIASLTITRLKKAAELAYEQTGISAIYLKSGDYDRALQLAEQVIQTQRSGLQTGYAYFYKAEAHYYKKEYDAAAEAYIMALPLLKKKSDLGAMILFDIGRSFEAAGKYAEALGYYRQLLDDYPAHFLESDTQMSVARCYELTGEPDKAALIYQNISSLATATLYQSMAEFRLQNMKLQPVKPAE